jgi:hypothetical protein
MTRVSCREQTEENLGMGLEFSEMKETVSLSADFRSQKTYFESRFAQNYWEKYMPQERRSGVIRDPRLPSDTSTMGGAAPDQSQFESGQSFSKPMLSREQVTVHYIIVRCFQH